MRVKPGMMYVPPTKRSILFTNGRVLSVQFPHLVFGVAELGAYRTTHNSDINLFVWRVSGPPPFDRAHWLMELPNCFDSGQCCLGQKAYDIEHGVGLFWNTAFDSTGFDSTSRYFELVQVTSERDDAGMLYYWSRRPYHRHEHSKHICHSTPWAFALSQGLISSECGRETVSPSTTPASGSASSTSSPDSTRVGPTSGSGSLGRALHALLSRGRSAAA